MKQVKRVLLTMAVGWLFFVGAGQSQGLVEDGPITYGDVQAAFQALLVGINIAADNSAPADGFRGRVSLTGDSFHCESDWILVGVGILVDKELFSRQEAQDEVDEIEILISQDAVPQETMKTALKSASYVVDENKVKVWYQNRGYFIAPGTLGLGSTHTFVFDIKLSGEWFQFQSSATIVPDGECDLPD